LHEDDDGTLGGNDPSLIAQDPPDGEYDDKDDAWVKSLSNTYVSQLARGDVKGADESRQTLWAWQQLVDEEFKLVSSPIVVEKEKAQVPLERHTFRRKGHGFQELAGVIGAASRGDGG